MSERAAVPLTYWCHLETPVGRLLLAGDGRALRRVHFQSGPHPLRPAPGWQERRRPFEPVIAELAEYFGGTRRAFSVALDPQGSAFQGAVWAALRAIPYGQTVSYGELARRLGRPSGARAVGL